MKLRVGDTVLVTVGKDRGKQGKVTAVLPKKNAVIVEGMNMYTRHVRPYADRSGEITRKERPLSLGKVAIINDKGEIDRVSYKVGKDDKKERVFAKTGTIISAKTQQTKKTKKPAKKSTKAKKK